ncbi:hypothetical protein V1514DRAFT_277378 [Lipomyces japonicus]|uniref:uncharacterized protein n=1 Tax=Lipomyces japonicus TaxID=56871 RepID=UPI0034CE51CF
MSGEYVDSAPRAAAEDDQVEVSKLEIGWIFVQSFYTTMNTKPWQLHQFYTKKSTLIHGVEGEIVPPLSGQQQINKKFEELNLQDCKVFVSNVDSQPSADNGVIVQVLGEMSNRGGPSRKFVETFFLAPQSKTSYYVLNDIFRFLKEDVDSDFEDEVAAEDAHSHYEEEPLQAPKGVYAATTAAAANVATGQTSSLNESVDNVQTFTPGPESVEQDEATIQEHFSEDHLLGQSEQEPAVEIADERHAAVPVHEYESPVDESSNHTPVHKASSTTPEVASISSDAVAVPPSLVTPSGPVSWAALAAKISAPAPVSALAPVSAPATAPAPAVVQADEKKRDTFSAYVKGVNEKVVDRVLKDALSKFGNLKHFEISRAKNCAFVDFDSAAALKSALDTHVLDLGDATVYVEERKIRAAAGKGNSNNFQRNGQPGGRKSSTAGANVINGLNNTETKVRNRQNIGKKKQQQQQQ